MTEKLQTEPVGKLLFKFAFPSIIATVATSLFNIIDSIFIGQILGAMAISGLAITFPFMNLTAAFGMIVGVGTSMLISISLGKGDKDKVSKIFNHMLLANMTIGISVSVMCLFFLENILFYFGASENTLPYAKEYMQYILLGNVITHIYFSTNAVFRALGFPLKSMQAVIQTVILNILFDALFILVLDMGIKGAAIATILAQVLSLSWQIFQIRASVKVIQYNLVKEKFDISLVRRILTMGSPQFLMNVSACFVAILINKSLMQYGGDFTVGAFGIANRVVFIFLMVVIGISQGMQPIAGYCYGSKNYERLIKVLKFSILGATVLTTSCFIVGFYFGEFISSLFTKDPELIALSVHGLKIIVLMMPFVGFGIITSTFFQSIGKSGIATILSLSRQVLFYIPALFILPRFLGVDGVWYSMPLADLAFVITAILFLYVYLPKLKIIENKLN